MENIAVIKKQMTDLLNDFPAAIEHDKQMIIKRLDGRKFQLASVDAYSKSINMPEKEHYFVTGEFIKYRYETHIKYTVRANATFKILAIIVPLMALPTLGFGLMSLKKMPQNYTPLLINVAIYLTLVGISTWLYLSQKKKFEAKGEQQFKQLLKRMEFN
jgi:hypothetical protein